MRQADEEFLAVVEPLAAAWMTRKVVAQMREHARQVLPYEGTEGPELGRQLMRAAARFETAAAWEQERRRRRVMAEGPAPGDGDEGAVVLLSTGEAAAVLEVGPRQVLNFIGGGAGPLPATRKGPRSPWRIRSDDLAGFAADIRCRKSEVAG